MVMVRELKKQKWARFKGKPHWIRCFAHVLNLIVQGILRPFGNQKQTKGSSNQAQIPPNYSDDSKSANDSPVENIITSKNNIDDSSNEDYQSSEVGSVDQDDCEDLESLDIDDIEQVSEEEEGDWYTIKCCKESLAKVSKYPSSLASLIQL
ncbi:uncharacterized protein PGTG_19843 [Puccinia graminis f. sp. tritici CRL 75-36-700-3]|uniref:Uncharacterized protein n=1 Tax=Puccinia graminis f. sp. tritici (strain CRL 75-36-700-3 / race SCCL) TaxID=418459 RepID=E3LB73_PUCGT|nr:uncharacterized protein PGTG_19843 [Puccinia graminis f. sp. tritici CRL 75-36-700-3]EFP93798.2 hypothetical protein PGTG_19843 [Puccinia graminis f. sp. tritici CRL 75-36-700-3]